MLGALQRTNPSVDSRTPVAVLFLHTVHLVHNTDRLKVTTTTHPNYSASRRNVN
jgi:hypothetical protein